MPWMTILQAIALANGSAMADGDAPQPATEQPETGTDAAVETFATEYDRWRRMTVDVRIGGEGPFRFMVDTGAQATVLSEDLANRLSLAGDRSATLVGMASTQRVLTTFVPDLALGNRSVDIRTAPILAARHIGGADGILGLDSLQDRRVLLDFRIGAMSVSDDLGDGGADSYDIVVRARERLGQLIIHRARIDGVRTAVIIDTGASHSIGNLALLDRLNRNRAVESSVMTDVNGARLVGETRVARRMAMGDVDLANVPIAFANSPTFASLELADRPAMILGMSELSLFNRVAIDFRTSRVMFDVPGDVPIDRSWNFNARATRLPGR